MLHLYNTLTKTVEEFVPHDPSQVTMYCCGPTVYDWAHIGNFRTYMMSDILLRTLRYLGFAVQYASNITDVGHMSSNADTGEDKMEKGAKREGKTAWDIAKLYTDAFLIDSKKLNITPPDFRPHATDFIKEQIAMVATLIDKGYAYTIDDGIYFDTGKCSDYGKLTGQNRDELKAGARVEPNPQKKHPTDFALWKFSPKNSKRAMEWESPWGKGFPGWHIECSAMSRTVLKTDQLDIHTGGMDLIPVHHTNEIAQSEAATGKVPFVRYWVHGQFMMVDNAKMAKSKGNFYRLADLEARTYDPLAMRYLYLTTHYRAFLNFTWEALTAAQNSLRELREFVSGLRQSSGSTKASGPFQKKFVEALENDLNMPQALAVVWEVAKSDIDDRDKYALLLDFDKVLGLGLKEATAVKQRLIPEEIRKLANKREEYRKQKKFAESDAVRKTIEAKGYILEDTPVGYTLKESR
jgi:cysteinyl-tRNA synthetase